MKTFYAICWVNGPVSARYEAVDMDDAVRQFEAATPNTDDSWLTHAEDDLEIDMQGMSEDHYESAMESAGYAVVRDLEPVHNYHGGTTAHLLGGWQMFGEL